MNRKTIPLRAEEKNARNHRRRTAMFLAMAAGTSLPWANRAEATTYNWAVDNGNWSHPANWSPKGVPSEADTVNIAESDNVARTITYNYTGAAVTLATLTIDLTGGSNFDTLSIAANNLASGNELIGVSGNGAVKQTGGSNTISNALDLGTNSGATGTYSLGGTASLSSGSETVGDNGIGTFNQTGGTNTSGVFNVGGGGTGTYSLSGTGSLSVSGDEVVGLTYGTFNQSGGTNTTPSLTVGFSGSGTFFPGGYGTYFLSGTASLSVSGNEEIGFSYESAGTFNQTGGTNTADGLYVGNGGGTGLYSLSGTGSLMDVSETVGDGGTGVFNQSGGTNTTGALVVGNTSTGTYSLSGTGSLSCLGESVTSFGIFNQTGGTNSITNTNGQLYVDGTYSLSGTSSVLSVFGEWVGTNAAGTFVQSGGDQAIVGNGNLVVGGVAGASGTYSLSGSSSLFCDNTEFIGTSPSGGSAGTGVFTQSGGTNRMYGLVVGGTYNLQGGTLTIVTGEPDAEYIGGSGTAIFNQTGGTNNNTGGVNFDVSGNASYFLSGSGSLSSPYERIGDTAAGTFNQSGGTNTISGGTNLGYVNGELDLGYASGGTGSYTLSNGSLSAGSIYLGGASNGAGGTGTFVQTGGTNAIDGLYIGSGGSGTYSLGGTGSLAVSEYEYVGFAGGTGTFIQTGGTNNTGGPLYVGDGGSGTYSLSGTASLEKPAETVGDGNPGTFNQSGGTNVTTPLVVGNTSSGLYSLSDTGSLTCGTESVTSFGIFNQSGGTNTITENGELTVDGTYSLSGTGSTLTCNGELKVGTAGAGTFIQSGGSSTVGGSEGNLVIGGEAGGNGTYSLSGSGSLFADNAELIGASPSGGATGAGVFTQSGGTNGTNYLNLGGIYNLQDGTLTVLPGPPNAEVVAGDGTATFNQTGGTNSFGELDLAPSSGSTGTYLLSGGSLTGGRSYGIYVGGSYLGGAGGTGILTVSGTGQLSVAGTLTVYPGGTVNINGGTSTVGGLSIVAGGVVNINNALFIDYGNGADPIASIAAWIASGYAGGKWNGPGIMSTAAQTNPNYGIGYADSADPGNPAGLSSGQIEIMYTLLGDANLDGKVNGIDFNLMAANFNQAVTDGWDEGDFNYDGKVNGNDFILLADNFNQFASQSDVSAADLTALYSFAAANDISLANVPEPVSGGMMVVAGLGILGRRRQRSL